jgi:predicted O-methyltransferase YrrM/glycosyltransferase involved in cell wall biosynthesis
MTGAGRAVPAAPVPAAHTGRHVGITLTSLDPEAGYGDWHTGHELGDALVRVGWPVTYLERTDGRWYRQPADLDAVVSLLDVFDVRNVATGMIRIAWVRNWTDRWIERPWFRDFDIVLTSSIASKRRIDGATGMSSIVFPIATNPARFAATGETAREEPAEVVLSVNRWGVERGIEAGLVRLAAEGVRVAVYGRGWESEPQLTGIWRGPRPYDDLPAIYRSARLVIDDAASSTAPYGSMNSRVFDALAAGALVVTNNELGAHELFDTEFPVWHDAEDLSSRVRSLLQDEPRRAQLAARYRDVVLREHTYAGRALRLQEIVDQRRPPMAAAPAVRPAPDQAPRASSPEEPVMATRAVAASARPPASQPASPLARRLRVVALALGAGAGVGVAAGVATALAVAVGATSSDAVVPVGITSGAAAASAFAAAALATARTRRDLRSHRRAVEKATGDTRAALAKGLVAVHGDVRSLRRELPAVAGLAPLGAGYPLPLGGDFPMAPDALAVLTRLVSERRPRLIVELGSGVSSLVLGLTARRLGTGRVISFDDEAHWADETRRRVGALDLSGLVEVVHAPLRRQTIAGESRPWYDIPAGSLPDEPIDLLVVDGPPGSIDPTGLARWPALPALLDRLAPGAAVFVDDAARDGERKMVDRWVGEIPGWRVAVLATERGTAILVRDDDPPRPAVEGSGGPGPDARPAEGTRG